MSLVKALQTIAADVMVQPALVPGAHDVFVCGNDGSAKASVVELLTAFGWSHPLDLGDIEGARASEMMLPMWLRLYQALGTDRFQFKVVRGSDSSGVS